MSEPQKKQITIRLESETIDYFKKLAAESGTSYQNLINLYLKDCVDNKRTMTLIWK